MWLFYADSEVMIDENEFWLILWFLKINSDWFSDL